MGKQQLVGLKRKPRHETRVISGDAHVYLLVRNLAAECGDVYTVHQTQVAGNRRTRIIGRELDLDLARTVVRRAEAMLKE